jgi:8-oxo-dGTP pyrophosphatase MutT (NUDIX family)
MTEPDGNLPPLYRLEGHTLEAEMLVLDTSTTDYAAHLLTNVEHPEWRESRGDAVMADALGVSGLLVTADRRIVIGRRSGRTHEAVGAFHVAPSGHPHPPQTVAQAFHAELEEELGVRPQNVRRSRLTGLIRARPSGKPELTARLDVDLEAELVVERWSSAIEKWEFESLEIVDWTARSVTAWLAQHGPQVVAPGYAAITLAAHADFGEDFRA